MFVRDEFGNLVFVPRNMAFAEAEGAEDGAGAGAGGEGAEAGKSGEEGGSEAAAGAAGEGDGKAAKDAGNGEEGAAAAVEADWRAGLPDDLKKHADRFNSVEDLVKANVDSRQKLSKAIIPPGKDADEDTVAAYRKAIGVPETADGYKFEMPEGQEPTDNDKAFHQTMAETFHNANISAEQAKILNGAWNELSEAMRQAQVEADKKFAEEAEAELDREWGKDRDANRAHANRAAEQVFGDDLEDFRRLETKDGRFVADHPFMLRALASLGREMAEGGLVPPLSADQAEQAEDELRGLRDKISEAQAKGDNKRANDLYQKEQALIQKMKGNRPIVGSEGRAA